MRLFLTTTVVVVTAALVGCRGWDSEKPPVHLIHNMDTQEKGKAYRKDTSGLFADGRMMRAPVEGTVARGQLDEDDLFELGTQPDGGPSQLFPEQVKVDGKITDDLRARGHDRFTIYCMPCHGIEGDGKGTVAQQALDGGPRLLVPPADFHSERLKTMVVGKMYSAIKNGVNNGNMPSYAAQIPTEDRWAIISYVRELQRQQDPNVQDEGGETIVVNTTGAPTAEMGAQLYKAKGCNACHTIDGSKLVGPSFKGIYGHQVETSAGTVTVDDAYLKESMQQPLAKIVNGFPPAMPTLPLTDTEIASLTLYIQSLK